MKLVLNNAIVSARGIMDGWVYKRFEDETVAAHLPTPNGAPPSVNQVRVLDRFTDAASYAGAVNADPVRKAVYAAALKRAGRSASRLRALMVGDFLHLPEVKELDLAEYRGRAGDKIKVWAVDDFEVVAVTVVIKDNATGNVIEQGNAVKGDTRWLYTTQTAIPAGQVVLIEGTAFDRPGNNTTLSDTWAA